MNCINKSVIQKGGGSMGEYDKVDPETGEMVTVYDIKDCLRAIRIRNQDNEYCIKYLQEEVKKLKEEHYKDNEIKRLKQALGKALNDNFRGFPISEKEEELIEEWTKEHDRKVHRLTSDKLRMQANGVSGGRYLYKFLPTSIGISGVIQCSCGAEFEFRKIGE